MPDAYPHDPDILPHQHENFEELFLRAYVPHPSDKDTVLSEPDDFEQ